MTKNDFILLSGRSNAALAKSIGERLDLEVHEPVSVFSDGEIRVRIEPNLRRRHVFIIQPTASPVNDSLMELLFMIDAAKRASAAEVTAVIPYFGYARQDRKEMARVPISSSVVTSMITAAGADRIVTVDIHSEQQEGFTKKPWDNLYGSYSLIPAIKERDLQDIVVAAPDKNGMLRATAYAKLLGAQDVALVFKQRDVKLNNVSDALDMIGDVEEKDVLIVDDMIDTGGTIAHAANFLKKRGAKSVRVVATHGLFSGEALRKIDESEIEEVLITDSIAQRDEVKKHPKIAVISIADLLAEAIRRIKTGESISKDLIW